VHPLNASKHVPARGGLLVGLALLAALAAACDESLATLAGPTPNLEPTFSSIQTNIFSNGDSSGRVACTTCHTNQGRTPAGGLNLLPDFSYAALVNVASRAKPGAVLVIPGNPEGSYLVHKLEGAGGIAGGRMPRNGPPFLAEGQITIVRRWIELGARND
jgi:hypothetical protein